jgi:hypothetical protein
MIVNSSELRVTDFDLRKVIPLQLEEVTRGNRCPCVTVLKHLHGMGARRYVLSVDNRDVTRTVRVTAPVVVT